MYWKGSCNEFDFKTVSSNEKYDRERNPQCVFVENNKNYSTLPTYISLKGLFVFLGLLCVFKKSIIKKFKTAQMLQIQFILNWD